MPFGTVIGDAIITYICLGTAPVALTGPIKVSLHTATPGTTGASEVTGGSYARQSVGYAAASGNACALTGTVSFTAMPSATVTHIGLWDSNATPKFIQGGALSGSVVVGVGSTFQLTAATNSLVGT